MAEFLAGSSLYESTYVLSVHLASLIYVQTDVKFNFDVSKYNVYFYNNYGILN